MDRPRNTTELHMFIDCINYYQDMWPSHAHILKPLTDHSGLKKHAPISWAPDMQTAFKKMCIFMVMPSLPTQTTTNVQEGRPVACFFRKLSKLQQNYMVIEKEMLCIIATLGQFQGMLLGFDIHVYTDHKNLTLDTLKMQ
ncbi:LOW QUALITY PROTEIN: hypothetical protein ACHAW6_004739 [Cyclotella cf. meneghiniana]